MTLEFRSGALTGLYGRSEITEGTEMRYGDKTEGTDSQEKRSNGDERRKAARHGTGV